MRRGVLLLALVVAVAAAIGGFVSSNDEHCPRRDRTRTSRRRARSITAWPRSKSASWTMRGSSSPARRRSCRASRRRGRTWASRRCGSANWMRLPSPSSARSRSRPTTATSCCWPRAWKRREAVWTKGSRVFARRSRSTRADFGRASRSPKNSSRLGNAEADTEAQALLDELAMRAPANLAIQLERARLAAKLRDAQRLRESVAAVGRDAASWSAQAREQFAVVAEDRGGRQLRRGAARDDDPAQRAGAGAGLLGEPHRGANASRADRRAIRSLSRARVAAGDAVRQRMRRLTFTPEPIAGGERSHDGRASRFR